MLSVRRSFLKRAGGVEETNLYLNRRKSLGNTDVEHYRLCNIYVEYKENNNDSEDEAETVPKNEDGKYVVSTAYPMWAMFLTKEAKEMTFTLSNLKKTYIKDEKRKKKIVPNDNKRHSFVSPHTKWRKAAKQMKHAVGILRSYRSTSRMSTSLSMDSMDGIRVGENEDDDNMHESKRKGSSLGVSTGLLRTVSNGSTESTESNRSLTPPTSPPTSSTTSSTTSSATSSTLTLSSATVSSETSLHADVSVVRKEILGLQESLSRLEKHVLGTLKSTVEESLNNIVERLTVLEEKADKEGQEKNAVTTQTGYYT